MGGENPRQAYLAALALVAGEKALARIVKELIENAENDAARLRDIRFRAQRAAGKDMVLLNAVRALVGPL